MNDLQIIEQRKVLEQEFKIYGSFEKPLFLAKDVARWIEHNKPSEMLRNIDNDEKIKVFINPSDNIDKVFQANTEYWFLTEDGLYEVLMQSRKPIAKVFKKEVKKILKELRLNGYYITEQPKENLEELKVKASQDRAKAMLLNAQNRMLKTLSKVVDNNKLSPIAVEVLGIKSIQEITGNKNLEQYLPQVPKTYSATEIGNILGVTANKIGSLAKSHNLKTEENGMWVMDKSKYSNKEVSTFRYFENAINVFRGLLA